MTQNRLFSKIYTNAMSKIIHNIFFFQIVVAQFGVLLLFVGSTAQGGCCVLLAFKTMDPVLNMQQQYLVDAELWEINYQL